MMMMSCQEVTELVTEYLEGRMPLLRRAQLHMHIGMCRHCRAYLGQMRQTVRVLGKLPDEPMPDDVKDELMRRLARMQASGD